MTAIFHYSMQLSMIVFAPHIGAELDWLQLTLMARERGRIGSDAALGDMPKRLQAHSYDEMNEGPAR